MHVVGVAEIRICKHVEFDGQSVFHSSVAESAPGPPSSIQPSVVYDKREAVAATFAAKIVVLCENCALLCSSMSF